MTIILEESGATPDAIRLVAIENRPVAIGESAANAIQAAYRCLERQSALGRTIYGVSTGLGAAVDTVVLPAGGERQNRIIAARAVGVGPFATVREVRAVMAARLSRIVCGRSGVSFDTAQALAEMLNRGLHPQMPLVGSLGEADLAPLAHVASVMTGAGKVMRNDGSLVSGADGFAAAGLSLPVLGIKDGLALVSSNAGAVGLACLVLADLRQALEAHLVALTLSMEAFRASLDPLDPVALRLRPVPGQDAVAGHIRTLLAGSDLLRGGQARRLQDPLSFRVAPMVLASAFEALERAEAAVAIELAASDDNPAVIAEEDRVLPTGNFDATHLALAFDTLALALARVSAAAAERMMKLMSPGFSDLPRFLAPPVPGANGFAALQKSIAALAAEIAHAAMPMPFHIVPVADRTEDYASMAMPIVRKGGRLADAFRILTAIELIVGAQGCDLAAPSRLGNGVRSALERVRLDCAALDEDRSVANDIRAIDAAILRGAFAVSTDPPSKEHAA